MSLYVLKNVTIGLQNFFFFLTRFSKEGYFPIQFGKKGKRLINLSKNGRSPFCPRVQCQDYSEFVLFELSRHMSHKIELDYKNIQDLIFNLQITNLHTIDLYLPIHSLNQSKILDLQPKNGATVQVCLRSGQQMSKSSRKQNYMGSTKVVWVCS